jgi:hypothetical protein
MAAVESKEAAELKNGLAVFRQSWHTLGPIRSGFGKSAGLMKRAAFLAAGFLLCGAATFAQGVPVAAVDVSLCNVAKDPKAFDGKSIRVKGTFHVSFESFTIFAKGCEAKSAVWVAFGGDVPGIVTSTANDDER